MAVISEGHWCDVIAWPQELSKEINLGGHLAKTPRLAVRWLQDQALRLARALDPQPGEGWAQGEAAGALRLLPDRLPHDWPDPGLTLRTWHGDHQAHETGMEVLCRGQPFTLTAQDYSAYFMLSARPLSLTLLSDYRTHEPHYASA